MRQNVPAPRGIAQLNLHLEDGTTYTGEGASLREAARDLVRRHAGRREVRRRLTIRGEAALALACLRATGALR